MNDAEVGTLMKTFVDNVKTYEQVVEVRASFFSLFGKSVSGFSYHLYACSFWLTRYRMPGD